MFKIAHPISQNIIDPSDPPLANMFSYNGCQFTAITLIILSINTFLNFIYEQILHMLNNVIIFYILSAQGKKHQSHFCSFSR